MRPLKWTGIAAEHKDTFDLELSRIGAEQLETIFSSIALVFGSPAYKREGAKAIPVAGRLSEFRAHLTEVLREQLSPYAALFWYKEYYKWHEKNLQRLSSIEVAR